MALVTAGVGLVGAIGGAAVGGITAARGARTGAETAARATAKQVQDQAVIDQAHWLRERRLEACRDFMEAYQEYMAATILFQSELNSASENSEPNEPANLRTASLALYRGYFSIRIVGPESLHEAAQQIRAVQGEHVANLHIWHSAYIRGDDQEVATARDRYTAVFDQLTLAYNEFLAVASGALAAPADTG